MLNSQEEIELKDMQDYFALVSLKGECIETVTEQTKRFHLNCFRVLQTVGTGGGGGKGQAISECSETVNISNINKQVFLLVVLRVVEWRGGGQRDLRYKTLQIFRKYLQPRKFRSRNGLDL